MADKQSTKPPAGTRDFLPDDIRRRQYVIGIIREVYEQYGFEPLETPAFENIETLLGKYGEEGNKLIFKILRRGEHEKSGEADLALRYDLTVPLARVVAQYQNELPKFFKRYQIQPVWRADRPARGRFREFYQCDIDSLGSTSALIEVEILSAVTQILLRLGFRDFHIRLNHRCLLTALLEENGLPRDQHAAALVSIDKLDKLDRERVVEDMVARAIDPATAVRCLDAFVRPSGVTDSEILERVKQKLLGNPEGEEAVANLQAIAALCSATSVEPYLRLDLGLARGLSYYTGAIMEIAVEGIGSLGGGGRYDNLIGMFLGRDIPACGFSLGLERILVVMSERQMFPADVAVDVDVLVTMWPEPALRAEAVKLAAELRSGGLRVEMYPEPDKIGRQFKYAADRRVRFVAVQGDNEWATGTVTIKNLTTGTQESVARTQAPAFVARTLNREREP